MKINSIIDKLRRVTSSGLFIPEIDGLRFIAIFVVVIFHIQGMAFLNPKFLPMNSSSHFGIIQTLYNNGWQGVELFFAISGFILGLPFARQHIEKAKKVKLKNYFLRRITRLEPPYFIVMIVYFLIHLTNHQYSFGTLFPHLLASLSYLHNVIFGNYLHIVSVAWSLEIEVQFYILAPLLSYVFCLKKATRRIVLVTAIIVFSAFQFYLTWQVSTIYSFLHFFLIGFLLVDLYVEQDKFKISRLSEIILGFASLACILMIDSHGSLFNHLIFILSIFVFYLLVLKYEFWKRILSVKVISTIGGMCYTIYLIHTPILHTFRNYSHYLSFTNDYLVNLIILTVVMSGVVLFLSSIFFYFIEKPCMKKDWYKDLYLKLKS